MQKARCGGKQKAQSNTEDKNERQRLAPIPCLPVRPSHPDGHKEALGVYPPSKTAGKLFQNEEFMHLVCDYVFFVYIEVVTIFKYFKFFWVGYV